MAAARRRVFVGKVLEKLFPRVPHGQEKRTALAPAPKSSPEKATPEKAKCGHIPPLTGESARTKHASTRRSDQRAVLASPLFPVSPAGGDTDVQPGRRLYTVSLPPEGYVPGPPEPHSCTSAENSSSSDDMEDQDSHDQPKRRRIRKPKSRKKLKIPNNVPVERAELEKQQSLLQEKLEPRHTGGPTISKNKKRKLKKKQQIKRKKAAGLPTRASGVSFTYQPEDSSSEQGDARESDGEDVAAAEGGAEEPDVAGAEGDAEKEGGQGANEEADGILDFLKSTQEIYFYDGAAKDSDPVSVDSTAELLRCLQAGRVAPSDLLALGRLKALLLLRDTEGLREALDALPGRCALPPDHVRVISAFFKYWITHILPENSE
ncbi:glutamate-rich protein 1 isoform X1 [Rhinolophus ferrumequinum]|uniref:glutamate-rich protein 1 isoform X1 n=1 Tax=Rhinolophus ferrumequinum TaxID=59479 RepID=UPI00140F667A|nr:glutamate-rich protein 1 isoform X1 [Rhinolophus ferrumequinum]